MPITTIELLTQQLKDAHQVFLATLEGITNDQADFQPQGKALSVAAVWIHHVEGEDTFLGTISGQPTLESGAWANKTGFNQPQPTDNWAETYPAWSKTIKADTAPLLDYTKAVFATSELYVATLTPEDLDQTINMGHMGNPTVLTVISSYIISHCLSITGEISAIKGVQGLKGYPW
jgi:hypothetical protein